MKPILGAVWAVLLSLVPVSANAGVTLNQISNNEVADATKVMGNFNALASEVSSQDARITVVEQSVGGGTTARTFTFSGFVPDVKVKSCLQDPCVASVHQANEACRNARGSNYVAASLGVLGEALKYGAPVTFPSEQCGIVVQTYTDGTLTWYQYLQSSTGKLFPPTATSCGANSDGFVTLLCGYWD